MPEIDKARSAVRAFFDQRERNRDRALRERSAAEGAEERKRKIKKEEEESASDRAKRLVEEFKSLGAPVENVERGYKLSGLSESRERRLTSQDVSDIEAYSGLSKKIKDKSAAKPARGRPGTTLQSMTMNELRTGIKDFKSRFDLDKDDEERLAILEEEMDRRLKIKPGSASEKVDKALKKPFEKKRGGDVLGILGR